jgi:hypothetical protein
MVNRLAAKSGVRTNALRCSSITLRRNIALRIWSESTGAEIYLLYYHCGGYQSSGSRGVGEQGAHRSRFLDRPGWPTQITRKWIFRATKLDALSTTTRFWHNRRIPDFGSLENRLSKPKSWDRKSFRQQDYGIDFRSLVVVLGCVDISWTCHSEERSDEESPGWSLN